MAISTYDGRFGLQSTVASRAGESAALCKTFAERLHSRLDSHRPFMSVPSKDKSGKPVNVDAGESIYLDIPSRESPAIIRQFTSLAAPCTGLGGVRASSVLISHAELELFKVEAILRGYVSGDVVKHYQEGVRSSCL